MLEVIRVKQDEARARSLLLLAEERLRDVKDYKPYKKVEEYWDISKELILAIMVARGLNTLSHKTLIEWARNSIGELSIFEINVLDTFRKARNDISYYGKKQKEAIIREFEATIRTTISKLLELAKNEINR